MTLAVSTERSAAHKLPRVVAFLHRLSATHTALHGGMLGAYVAVAWRFAGTAPSKDVFAKTHGVAPVRPAGQKRKRPCIAEPGCKEPRGARHVACDQSDARG